MNNNNNLIGYDGIVSGMVDCWNDISSLKLLHDKNFVNRMLMYRVTDV